MLPVIEAAAKMGVSICVHPTIWDKAADARLPRYSFANSFGSVFTLLLVELMANCENAKVQMRPGDT